MDRNNRPQGRETYVTSESKGVHRKGEGLGTGPVGKGGAPGGNQSGGNRAASSGRGRQQSAPTRASGNRSLLGIILAAVIALGGGGGILSALNGGGGSADNYDGGYGSGGNQSSYATPAPVSTARPDNTVVKGARAKRTEILGSGRDQVTLMVYMCGTDLESKYGMATSDLSEMASARLSDKLNIVVYTGGCSQWKTQGISSSVNQIYQVSDRQIRQLVANDGSKAMTDPETLSAFIRYCNENFPANRNELILWDHGGGSVSGYGYDENNPRKGSMSLAGLNTALKNAGVTFDFIGFDACLMATVENGLMLNEYADYMIASEETEPGIGWYYTDWVSAFAANTSMPTVELGKLIADDFVRTCGAKCRGQSATLSVVDLAELSYTAPAALKDFSESLSDMIADREYSQISEAREGAREFARSSAIDQIDLVDFAGKIGNSQGQELAEALLGAVKYNTHSSNMGSSYGLSIYFPYRKSSSVDSAVRTYSAIGMDESYSNCIRQFASLEVSGQAATGGSANPMGSLLGELGGSLLGGGSGGGADLIGGLLGAFLGGGFDSVSGLSGRNIDFLEGAALTEQETAEYISGHRFDPSGLAWTRNAAGDRVISLPEDQWDLIVGIDANLFYDDGRGFADLGLDNVYQYDDEGNLVGGTDGTWLGVNAQPVAYYHEYDGKAEDGSMASYGVIPVLLNGDRAELLIELVHGRGAVVGARPVYLPEEETGEAVTDTIAKSLTELAEGDEIVFICDFYNYDGTYDDTYVLDTQYWSDDWQINNIPVGDGTMRLTYRFTDIFQQHYWTEPIEF